MNKKILVKKGIILTIVILILVVGIIPFVSGIVVGSFSIQTSDENILYVGGLSFGNYSSIQDAINDAFNGCTIFVYNDSSPYYENVVIHKTINLIGEDIDTTIIDGENRGDVVLVSANK